MATTKFDICSRASTRVGGTTITSFEDGSSEAIIAGREYEEAAKFILSKYRWRFASEQYEPNRLTETPKDEWSYYWQMPATTLVIHAVKVAGEPIEYDRYGDKIACDADDGVVIDHTFRAAEATWPPYFINLVTDWMEAIYAGALKRDFNRRDALKDTWEKITLPDAKNLDAQQQTNKKFAQSRLVKVRR